MKSIQIRSHVDADGKLTIKMPKNFREKNVKVVVQTLESEQKSADEPKNSQKKPNISEIIEGFRQLRQEIPTDDISIREMIEEGRRY